MVKNEKVRQHFQINDPRIAVLIETIPLEDILPAHPDDYFLHLCRNIIGQQLSGKAADTIYARFESSFGSTPITPKAVYESTDDALRNIGMSRSKVSFLKDLAQKIHTKEIDLSVLTTLSDSEVVATLTKIKGIGPWTAEMFLIFTLGREDVFSFGDLGLKRAIQKLYGLRKEPTISKMEKLSKRWQPYRTYAARVLWRYKDGN
jgi:DNA-3-methyladenine glycosylase II